jgi:hypothetical protein
LPSNRTNLTFASLNAISIKSRKDVHWLKTTDLS